MATNSALREHSYSDTERASILEAFLRSYSHEATLSPIVNTLPMGAPPVSSAAIDLVLDLQQSQEWILQSAGARRRPTVETAVLSTCYSC